MTKDEEKGYIERVLAGDESAYEPLVTENQTKVYRLALRILKNEADAEDAAQEAFLKAYTSLADFRGDSRFSVWLYRLTNNICIDMLRKNTRAVIVSLETDDDALRESAWLSYDEIAAALSLEVGTVKSRLNRARKKLCIALLKSGNFSDRFPSKQGKGCEA